MEKFDDPYSLYIFHKSILYYCQGVPLAREKGDVDGMF